MTVWITDADGREEKTRIVSVSGDIVTTSAGADDPASPHGRRHAGQSAPFRLVDQRRLDRRWCGWPRGCCCAARRKPGKTAATTSGRCLKRERLARHRHPGIDALIRGRKTIYETSRGSTRVHAAPIVTRRARGTTGLAQFLTWRQCLCGYAQARFDDAGRSSESASSRQIARTCTAPLRVRDPQCTPLLRVSRPSFCALRST